jgi:glycosyltransferase involved in cell wall biosynthesis
MKLNWFSPLPPAKSGIAVDFFRTILPALIARADVTLWTDQNEWASSLENHARVRTFQLNDMPWVELNRADVTFFNLGNNHLFHGTIWEVSRRLAGVTILHDLRLDEFFLNWRPSHLSSGNRAAGSAQQSTDLTFALENSLGVVVHTSDAYDRLNALNRWIVSHIPLAFSLPESARGPRPTRGPTAPYRLIVFGFIHQNRRLPALLEALGTLPEKDKFQLDVYGELWDSALVERAIADYGLKKSVRIRGFVAEDALDAALASADIAINLRYPSAEASGSQLRIWSHELPSIVTRAGWFADLPDTAVLHVSPDNEVADIQKYLRNFAANPAQFQQMGREGKRLLYPTHAPETYVDALLNLARQVIEFRPRSAAHYLARRTGERMTPWIDSVTSDDPLRRVAEEMLALTR